MLNPHRVKEVRRRFAPRVGNLGVERELSRQVLNVLRDDLGCTEKIFQFGICVAVPEGGYELRRQAAECSHKVCLVESASIVRACFPTRRREQRCAAVPHHRRKIERRRARMRLERRVELIDLAADRRLNPNAVQKGPAKIGHTRNSVSVDGSVNSGLALLHVEPASGRLFIGSHRRNPLSAIVINGRKTTGAQERRQQSGLIGVVACPIQERLRRALEETVIRHVLNLVAHKFVHQFRIVLEVAGQFFNLGTFFVRSAPKRPTALAGFKCRSPGRICVLGRNLSVGNMFALTLVPAGPVEGKRGQDRVGSKDRQLSRNKMFSSSSFPLGASGVHQVGSSVILQLNARRRRFDGFERDS